MKTFVVVPLLLKEEPLLPMHLDGTEMIKVIVDIYVKFNPLLIFIKASIVTEIHMVNGWYDGY